MKNVRNLAAGLVLGVIGFACVAGLLLYAINQAKPSQIVRINSENPTLQKAIGEAQKGMDDFIKALNTPKPDQRFAVKGTFQTLGGPEYLWVRKPVFKDGNFSGELDQQPIALTGKHKGDPVSFAKKDAVDWLIKDDNGIRGTFTEKVLVGH